MAETYDHQSSSISTAPSTPTPITGKATINSQIPSSPCVTPLQCSDVNKLPIIYPMLVPGLVSAQNPEEMNRGPGIYAVPVLPFMGTVTGIPTNALIPLTYHIPTRSSASEGGAGSGEQNQMGQQQQQPQQLPPPQRQIVFQIAFQLDLLLIIKLAAVIFILNKEGSRQRLALLVFFASIVYLFQTGALTPLMRWISRAMHRAAVPPQLPSPRDEPVVRRGNENAMELVAEGQPAGAEDDNQPLNANQEAENEAPPEARVEGGNQNQWWGIVKEVQMIVFGFITSLLPGFHNIDHA